MQPLPLALLGYSVTDGDAKLGGRDSRSDEALGQQPRAGGGVSVPNEDDLLGQTKGRPDTAWANVNTVKAA